MLKVAVYGKGGIGKSLFLNYSCSDHPCRQSFYSFILKLFNTITVVSFSPNALQMNESDTVIFPIILSAVIQISQHELHASIPYTCIST